MLKPKRVKKCKGCGDEFTAFQTTQKACSITCALDIGKSSIKKDIAKKTRKDKRQFLDSDIKHVDKKAQQAFNEYIRLRDKGCISCEAEEGSRQFHAGHYKTVGAHRNLRFNEDNCHKQCSICNNHLSGNLINYRKNLISKIGIDRVKSLENYNEPVKYTIDELKHIIKKYRALSKQIKESNID